MEPAAKIETYDHSRHEIILMNVRNSGEHVTLYVFVSFRSMSFCSRDGKGFRSYFVFFPFEIHVNFRVKVIFNDVLKITSPSHHQKCNIIISVRGGMALDSHFSHFNCIVWYDYHQCSRV